MYWTPEPQIAPESQDSALHIGGLSIQTHVAVVAVIL